MAASSTHSRYRRFVCAVRGHDWGPDRPLHGHYFCRRCKRYDDAPGIDTGHKRWRAFRSWMPLWISVGKRETVLRLGWVWHRHLSAVSAQIALHYGWERHSEGPGIRFALHLWRLRAGCWLGGFWQDEDASERALFRLWSDFNTEGWRYLPCWRGHKPKRMKPPSSYVYCERCDETIETGVPSAEEPIAA